MFTIYKMFYRKSAKWLCVASESCVKSAKLLPYIFCLQYGLLSGLWVWRLRLRTCLNTSVPRPNEVIAQFLDITIDKNDRKVSLQKTFPKFCSLTLFIVSQRVWCQAYVWKSRIYCEEQPKMLSFLLFFHEKSHLLDDK